MKLLELVKSYDEFKNQRPPTSPPEDSAEEPSGPDAAANGPSLTDSALLGHRPAPALARSFEDLEADVEPQDLEPLTPSSPRDRRTPLASNDAVSTDTASRSANGAEPTAGIAREASSTHALYDEALLAVSKLCEAAGMETISPGRLHDAARQAELLSASLIAHTARDDSLLGLALGTYPEGEGFVLPHSANVAILGSFVGKQLEISDTQLTRTVLAGLTHDIGNVQIPPGLLYKEQPLAKGELDEIRRRPTYSHDLLVSLGGDFREVAEIALQVYERLDGSGYPGGLKGNQILLEARILGAVDFFETTIHPRPYKDSPPGDVSFGIQTLMRMAAQFGRDVLKALVRSVGLFPVGTYVRLSTGEVARVLRGSRDNPMRPFVEVVFDKRNQRAETSRRIDLVASPHLYVSRPLSNPELVELRLLDAPRSPGNAVSNETTMMGGSSTDTVTDVTRVRE